MSNQRYLIIMCLFLAIAVLVCFNSFFSSQDKISIAINNIPIKIGDWEGKDSPIEEEIFNILETKAVLVRKYIRGENSVNLAIVYYGDTKLGFHRPEACFTGQGATINARTIDNIEIGDKKIDVNRLLLSGAKGNRLMLYWFQTGSFYTANYKKFRWQIILNRIQGKKQGAAMVQISTTVNDDNELKAESMIKKFGKSLVQVLPRYLK